MGKSGNPEDSILEARLRDAVRIAESQHRPHFIGFLDERQAVLAKRYMQNSPYENYQFWGGHPEAERVLLGTFPEYLEPCPEEFPLCPVTARFRREDLLSHRDFLGALLNRGVERDTLGDILLEKGRAVLFVRREVRDFLLQQTEKIGRTGIRWEEGAQEPYPAAHSFLECTGVVASSRLDCLTAAVSGISREKAAELVRSGLVMVDHQEEISVSAEVAEGCVVSIRGKGRFIVDRLGPITKKGRLSIAWRKYI